MKKIKQKRYSQKNRRMSINNNGRIMFSIFLFFILPLCIFGKGSSEQIDPVDKDIPEIQNKEHLIYGIYNSGEKIQELHMVTEKEVNSASIETWVDLKNLNLHFIGNEIPKDYKSFRQKIVTSLENGMMIDYLYNYQDMYKKNDLNGKYYRQFKRRKDVEGAKYISKVWDGYETQESLSRMKLKPSVPAVTVFTSFVNLRFLDLRDGGVIAMIEPEIISSTAYGSISIKKHETIETKAGSFNTIKIILTPGNFIIKTLIGPLADSLVFWFENASRKRLIKMEMPNPGSGKLTYILEKTGSWEN